MVLSAIKCRENGTPLTSWDVEVRPYVVFVLPVHACRVVHEGAVAHQDVGLREGLVLPDEGESSCIAVLAWIQYI